MSKNAKEIRQAVQRHYADAISQKGSCCGPQPIQLDPKLTKEYVQLAGYSDDELAGLPDGVATFGCGNPVNLAGIKPGDVVLDLGSGAGMDLILAAKKAGQDGKAIGLDMTPEMIDTCRKNLAAAGLTNAEVRQGEMEKMPVTDGEVDWILSNCVINLSPEKEKVFAEAFRVLKPGGQMMVADIVTLGLEEKHRDDMQAWSACLSGAVDESDYLQLARDAGFEDVKIVARMVYTKETLSVLATEACCGEPSQVTLTEEVISDFAEKVASVKLSARKPG
jgi:ubiquinone/menaquinone biosynthesis C-methylase UbiE